MKEKDIQLKSEPMNEMLSHPPSWIVRSGNGLFLIVLLVVLGLSWVIKYPDEISGDVTVASIYPPIEISNQGYVQLKNIAVRDQVSVKKGQLLLEFDNKADLNDIEKVKSYLKVVSKIITENHGLIPILDSNLALGTYQESWLNLQVHVSNWNQLQTNNFLQSKIQSISKEIKFREELQSISSRKIKLAEKDFEFIKNEVATLERLVNENAISKQNLDQERKAEIQSLNAVENTKEQLIQNMIQINSLKKEKAQLVFDSAENERKLKSLLEISIATIENNFNDWNLNSTWISPCDGKVAFNTHLQENKYYLPNKASLVIVPNGNEFFGIASIPNVGAGKIKIGQKTHIELIDFPKIEYGVLEGIVTDITQIAKDGKYEVKVKINSQGHRDKLKTTFNKIIPPKAELKGSVRIITNDKRLLERFFEKILNMFL